MGRFLFVVSNFHTVIFVLCGLISIQILRQNHHIIQRITIPLNPLTTHPLHFHPIPLQQIPQFIILPHHPTQLYYFLIQFILKLLILNPKKIQIVLNLIYLGIHITIKFTHSLTVFCIWKFLFTTHKGWFVVRGVCAF